MPSKAVSALCVLALAGVTTAIIACQEGPKPIVSDRAIFSYPVGSPLFADLVADSYKVAGAGKTSEFDQWWDASFKVVGYDSAKAWAEGVRQRLRRTSDKTEIQRLAAEQTFKVIKKSLPTFSLDRGYEFTNAVGSGERQCLLQSVLIAGTLQAAGLDAGCVMVWSNERDEVSNLGHVAAILTLNNGRSVLIDASDPTPYATHAGIFMVDTATKDYRFLRPTYNAAKEITAFTSPDSVAFDASVKFKPLDYDYIRSQFDFYRGERIPGGFLDHHAEETPLRQSAKFLQSSVDRCPNNPLALLCLGRALTRLNDPKGLELVTQARGLYELYGWLPPGIEGK